MALPNPFNSLRSIRLNGAEAQFYSLPALAEQGFPHLERLPVSIRIMLESLLRNCDGKIIKESDVRNLAEWDYRHLKDVDIPFIVGRVILQDFTGVPLVVDLAAMRDAVAQKGRDPLLVEPMVPVDLVIDHSVQVDQFGTNEAFLFNLKLEFERNQERYAFLKWGQQAFKTFGVVPPGIGIVRTLAASAASAIESAFASCFSVAATCRPVLLGSISRQSERCCCTSATIRLRRSLYSRRILRICRM